MQARRGSPPQGLNKNILIRFIEVYKESCCLWDATHRDYRNKKVKAKAMGKLLKIYQEENPNATKAKVQAKIYEIRQKYARLRRKTLEDPSFVPKLWYYNYLHFLSPQGRSKRERERDVSDEDEETKLNKTLASLLKFLPYEQRDAARNFISEITNRAKINQMGVLKLSMRVGDNDVTLIPYSGPICSMSTPCYSGVTPEELERQDIAETQNAVKFLRLDTIKPNDNIDPEVIVIDDD